MPQKASLLAATDEEVRVAKQLHTLAIDAEYALAWVTAMERLVGENLDDVEFTARRMAQLKTWTKGRKLAQSRLHHRYDLTGRRPRRLVDRDTRQTLKDARARIDEYRTNLANRQREVEERRGQGL